MLSHVCLMDFPSNNLKIRFCDFCYHLTVTVINQAKSTLEINPLKDDELYKGSKMECRL